MVALPGDIDDLFRTFMDQSPMAAWMVDADDRLRYSSEPFPLTDDQVGSSMWDLVPAEYVRPYRDALHRARDNGQTEVVTAPGPRLRDGLLGEGWFRAYYFPLPDGWVGGVGVDVTDVVEAQEALAASRQRIVAAGDEARRRIERDLHDGVQQRLIVQLLKLRVVRQRVERDPAAAAELLDASLADLEEAVEELRELARGIHPSTLTRAGLGPALEGLARRAPIPVRLRCSARGRLPEAVEVAAYFFCAEALTNMAKHSRATAGEISVLTAGGALLVEVSDDGVGGVREQRGGGLEGLRDRVEALRGQVEIRERAGGGTLLRSTIPLA